MSSITLLSLLLHFRQRSYISYAVVMTAKLRWRSCSFLSRIGHIWPLLSWLFARRCGSTCLRWTVSVSPPHNSCKQSWITHGFVGVVIEVYVYFHWKHVGASNVFIFETFWLTDLLMTRLHNMIISGSATLPCAIFGSVSSLTAYSVFRLNLMWIYWLDLFESFFNRPVWANWFQSRKERT